MLKDAFEDYKRYQNDEKENNTKTEKFDHESKNFKKAKWKDIRVGDIIKVYRDEQIPCDMVILTTKM